MEHPTYCYKQLKNTFAALDPTGETGVVYEAAMQFTQDHIAPFDRAMNDSKIFPTALWPHMGEAGLLGIMMPAQYGGAEGGYRHLYAVISAISYGSGSAGLSMLAHSLLGMDRINEFGSAAQKETYLPDLIAGRKVAALAMTEPNAGSDVVRSMQTKAIAVQRDGIDGFELNGGKTFITNAPGADVFVLYAKTAADQITAFLIDRDTTGLSVGPAMDKIGMRGSETSEVFLSDCFVPADHVLGAVGQGEMILKHGLLGERFGLAAIGDGLTRHAIDKALDHTATRQQFGTDIRTNQGVSFPLADAAAKLDMLQDNMLITATLGDDRSPLWTVGKTAKLFLNASLTAVEVTQDCTKLGGGMGYTNDYPFGRLHNDALLLSTGGGTENIRRMIIANEMYKP